MNTKTNKTNKTGATTRAKSGLQRKRESDDRQRKMGRFAFQIWVTPEEADKLKTYLEALRSDDFLERNNMDWISHGYKDNDTTS